MRKVAIDILFPELWGHPLTPWKIKKNALGNPEFPGESQARLARIKS
jgi:hypothetical protein